MVQEIDGNALKASAIALAKVLEKYTASDSEARIFSEAISPTIVCAERGEIQQPIPRGAIPGSRFFNESNLRQYKDLEDAVAEFKIQLTGGYTPAVKVALKSICETRDISPTGGQDTGTPHS